MGRTVKLERGCSSLALPLSMSITFFLTNSHLRESMKRGVYVDGLSEHIVTSAKEAYQVILHYVC